MTGWRREWGRFTRDRASALGLTLLLVLILAAIFAPLLAPFPGDVVDFHTANRLHAPDAVNWLGTDRMGSDLFSRILFGARITITIAFVAVGSAVVVGVPIGLVAGYYGGWPSNLLMRVSDIFLAVPQIVLAIAIAQTLGPSIENVILALSITYWPFWARLVFAETRSLKNEVFIESAIALGASPLRVMTLHVLPNIASAIIVLTSIGMGATILTAAALGFLGLGAPPPVEELSLGFATEAGFASVLDRVNLSIERGRVLGLVGESGCGKTTLARAILGVLPRDSARITGGRVLFRGTDLLTADPSVVNQTIRGRAITFVPQDPFTSFNPVFTVGEQIMEILKWKSPRAAAPAGRGWLPAVASPYPSERKRADYDAVMELLDAVQLPRPDQMLRKYPHELSGGQRQRLMIAMALLPGPDLVIADEPTTALDVTIQAQILGLIRRLATERNVAVLLTTHDLGAAYEICDAVNVMYAGQDVESAPVDRFFAAPAHPYTTKLLASLPDADGTASGIPGEVPVLITPPSGCRFHPRCERAAGPCRETRPPVDQLGGGHWVRCYHPHREAP